MKFIITITPADHMGKGAFDDERFSAAVGCSASAIETMVFDINDSPHVSVRDNVIEVEITGCLTVEEFEEKIKYCFMTSTLSLGERCPEYKSVDVQQSD